jgi:hypothetical protein
VFTEQLEKLATTGLLGLLLTMALGAIYYLYKKLMEEKDAHRLTIEKAQTYLNEEKNHRINDGKETQKVILDVQKTMSDAMNKVADVIEWLEKRNNERRSTTR